MHTSYPWIPTATTAHRKLASSAVHPLVARARGYEVVTEATLDSLKPKLNYRSKNTAWYRTIWSAVAGADALYMPWYSLAKVAQATPNEPSTFQLRPARPIANVDDDKPQKYINEPGHESVLDVHPATPTSFFTTAPTIIVAEGLLKADAALSAYLYSRGFTDEKMPSVDNLSRFTAREALTSLMELIPVDDQVLITSVIGVGNWHNKPEWNTLRLTDKNVILAFDADVAVNPHVWWQAEQMRRLLERKGANVKILSLPTEEDEKQGVDDFFAAGHTFGELLDYATYMPDKPDTVGSDSTLPLGSWRINSDGASASKLTKSVIHDGSGQETSVKEWVPASNFGGRLVSRTTYRQPTVSEMANGKIDHSVGATEAVNETVQIGVAWHDRQTPDVIHHDTVNGPIRVLTDPPERWGQIGAFGSKVENEPGWPPRDRSWLDAVKAHRPDDQAHYTRFLRMGWIPSDDDAPFFVVGNQRITWQGIFNDALDYYSVSDQGPSLAGFERFGVIAPPDGVNWIEQARNDIAWMGSAYFTEETRAWKSLADAAVIAALMVRPALPVRPSSIAFLYGPAGSGKSWSASAAMMGWQGRGGQWTNQALPGSARDTYASTEISVATAPLWVIDDLAPSVSRRVSEQLENTIGDIVRFVHDGTPRRRSTIKGSLQNVHTPNALLIITSENELSIESVNERIAPIYFDTGSLSTTELVNHGGRDGIQARLMGAFIRWLCLWAASEGWDKLVGYVAAKQANVHSGPAWRGESATERATHLIDRLCPGISGGLRDRLATTAGELTVGLELFGRFCLEVMSGWLTPDVTPATYTPFLPRKHGDIRERVTDLQGAACCQWDGPIDNPWFPTHPDLSQAGALLMADLIAVKLADTVGVSTREKTPGYRLVEAIGDMLTTHMAVLVGEDGGIPAIEGYSPAVFGWVPQSDGGFTMSGLKTIGTVMMHDGAPVALLSQKAAFMLAARYRPDLVTPGQKSLSTWKSALAQGLLYTREAGGWALDNRRVNATIRVNGMCRRATPVLIETLLGQKAPDDDPDTLDE